MLGQTAVSLTVESLSDSVEVVDEISNTGCRKLLSNETDPLLLYTASVSVDPFDMTGFCHNINASYRQCSVSLSFLIGSNLMRTTESRPGVTHLEIFINAGAIVGGVQFFTWLLMGG